MADEKKKEEKPAAKTPAAEKSGLKVQGATPKGGAAPAAAPAAPAAAPGVAPAPEKKIKPSARHMGSAKSARRKLRKKKSQIQARRKKEFTYRGHSMEELLKLPFADIIELLPARARRTYIRGLNIEQEAFVKRLRRSDGKPVRTHRREIPILPEFVGKTVHIYNGKAFQPLDIKPEMIGHALGEFAMTRKSVKHSGLGVGATRSSKFMPLK